MYVKKYQACGEEEEQLLCSVGTYQKAPFHHPVVFGSTQGCCSGLPLGGCQPPTQPFSCFPSSTKQGGTSAYLRGSRPTCCLPRDLHGAIGCSRVAKSPMGCSDGAETGLSASISVEASVRSRGWGETCLLPHSYFVIESAERVTVLLLLMCHSRFKRTFHLSHPPSLPFFFFPP